MEASPPWFLSVVSPQCHTNLMIGRLLRFRFFSFIFSISLYLAQRLRKELEDEHDRVQRLSTQLSTNVKLHVITFFHVLVKSKERNVVTAGFCSIFIIFSSSQAHVVSAFEQSLHNMTSR